MALDPSNPLALQAGFVFLPTTGVDLVSNKVWAKAGSTPPTIAATGNGLATLHTSGAATVSYVDLGTPLGAAVDLGQMPSTYVGVFYANSTTGVAIAERNDGNATNIGWVLGYVADGGGGNGLGFVQEFGTTNLRRTITNTVSTGLNVLVVTHDGTPSKANVRVYLNGVEGTYNTGQDGSGTSGSDAGQNLYVGRNTFDTSKSHDGSILLAAAFRRLWSAVEVASFSANPWQLFKQADGLRLSSLPSGATPTPAPLMPIIGRQGLGERTGRGGLITRIVFPVNLGRGAAFVSPDITIAITGQGATGAIGTLTPAFALALAGNAGTGAAGTITPAFALALSGQQGAGAVGTIRADNATALTGQATSGQIGTLTPAFGVALTGAQGTAAVGTLVPNFGLVLSGLQGTGQIGTVGVSLGNDITLGLTGVGATAQIGVIIASFGIVLTGQQAAGAVGTVTVTNPDKTFALSGVAGTGSVGTVGVTGADVSGDIFVRHRDDTGVLERYARNADGTYALVLTSVTGAGKQLRNRHNGLIELYVLQGNGSYARLVSAATLGGSDKTSRHPHDNGVVLRYFDMGGGVYAEKYAASGATGTDKIAAIADDNGVVQKFVDQGDGTWARLVTTANSGTKSVRNRNDGLVLERWTPNGDGTYSQQIVLL